MAPFVWERALYVLADGRRAAIKTDGVVFSGAEDLLGLTVHYRNGGLFRLERGSEVELLGRVVRRVETSPPKFTASTPSIDRARPPRVRRSLTRSRTNGRT